MTDHLTERRWLSTAMWGTWRLATIFSFSGQSADFQEIRAARLEGRQNARDQSSLLLGE